MYILEKMALVYYSDINGGKFPFIVCGRSHIFVSPRLISNDKIALPVKDAHIVCMANGMRVLLPGGGTVAWKIHVPCGFLGSSSFKVLSPVVNVIPYSTYKWPRERLGKSVGAIIVAPDAPLMVRWERTGQLYGASGDGVSILYPDGREESFDDIADVSDISELKKLVE